MCELIEEYAQERAQAAKKPIEYVKEIEAGIAKENVK